MKKIQFEVLGQPAPKGSSRAVMARDKSRAILLASGSKKNEERQSNWRTDVRDAARKAWGSIGHDHIPSQTAARSLEQARGTQAMGGRCAAALQARHRQTGASDS
jgi:hypothetical protein